MISKKLALKYWDATQTVDNDPTSSETKKFCEKYGYESRVFQVDYDEMVIYFNKDEALVVIGGSSYDKHEWIGNFRAYKTIDDIHKNYYKSSLKIIGVLRILNIINIREDTVTFIGHSRGGAIAQILRYFNENGNVISYGSPKPFTKRKKKELEFNHTAFTSIGDIVTYLPPRFFPPFWRLYATEVIKLKPLRGKMEHINYDIMIKEQM